MVTITNKDGDSHTFTTDPAGVHIIIAPGAKATFKAPKKGSYAVHCDYHAEMHGTLVVA